MLPNTATLSAARVLQAAALIALAACTDPKGPGADSDSACLLGCDGADAGGGDGAADGSDGSTDGGDGGDGTDVPYLALTSIYPGENATEVPVDVVLEATFDSEYAMTSDDVFLGLYLPPDYDNPLPATMELYHEGVMGGLQVYRLTATPDEALLFSTSYLALVSAGYSSAGGG